MWFSSASEPLTLVFDLGVSGLIYTDSGRSTIENSGEFRQNGRGWLKMGFEGQSKLRGSKPRNIANS